MIAIFTATRSVEVSGLLCSDVAVSKDEEVQISSKRAKVQNVHAQKHLVLSSSEYLEGALVREYMRRAHPNEKEDGDQPFFRQVQNTTNCFGTALSQLSTGP
jgi:hypothetical protein